MGEGQHLAAEHVGVPRPYHHGDLPAALLDAVEALLSERGVAEVSLRAVARRAGVSHTAPAHHFRDKAGLISAFAVRGFEGLTLALERGPGRHPDRPRFLGVGLGYVGYAVAHPARFRVMFRPELLREDRDLRGARETAFGVLLAAVRAESPDVPEDVALQIASGAWSIVHGFATLWLDGNLAPEIARGDPEEAAAAVLQAFIGTVGRFTPTP